MRRRVLGQTPRDSGDTRAHTDRPSKSEADQLVWTHVRQALQQTVAVGAASPYFAAA